METKNESNSELEKLKMDLHGSLSQLFKTDPEIFEKINELKTKKVQALLQKIIKLSK